ncbi:hypothetical protein MVEN_01963300 [Mycena venus]|uniref:Uncharacterized protein n=1 Tax=Mycena venus TaxID=2733690 RepID=A0A8H6XH58_9AGAR|nr:hypothetical protein MVEN_01963300 [Mycena venus]
MTIANSVPHRSCNAISRTMLVATAFLAFISSVFALGVNNVGRIITAQGIAPQNIPPGFYSKKGVLYPSSQGLAVSTDTSEPSLNKADLSDLVYMDMVRNIHNEPDLYTIRWVSNGTECTMFAPKPPQEGDVPATFQQSAQGTGREENNTTWRWHVKYHELYQCTQWGVFVNIYTICVPGHRHLCLTCDSTGALLLKTLNETDPSHKWVLDMFQPDLNLTDTTVSQQVDQDANKDDPVIVANDGADGVGGGNGGAASASPSAGAAASSGSITPTSSGGASSPSARR